MDTAGSRDDFPVDPLDVLAGAAAGAAAARAPKRKQALKPGRDVCFVAGCTCSVGLKAVPKDRVADANYAKCDVTLSLGNVGGKARVLPNESNKLCPDHYPVLTEQRLIGADVLVETDGRIVLAKVVGAAPLPVGLGGLRGARAARAARQEPSDILWQAVDDQQVAHDLTAAEVWAGAQLRTAYNARTRWRRRGRRTQGVPGKGGRSAARLGTCQGEAGACAAATQCSAHGAVAAPLARTSAAAACIRGGGAYPRAAPALVAAR